MAAPGYWSVQAQTYIAVELMRPNGWRSDQLHAHYRLACMSEARLCVRGAAVVALYNMRYKQSNLLSACLRHRQPDGQGLCGLLNATHNYRYALSPASHRGRLARMDTGSTVTLRWSIDCTLTVLCWPSAKAVPDLCRCAAVSGRNNLATVGK